jgi:putative transposase
MPGKNTIKQFSPDSYYHLYNRGVEKRKIFLDSEDFGVFLSYLKTYLLPKDSNTLQEKLADEKIPWSQKDKILKLLRLNNFSGSLSLIAYCFMPNHFHFLIHQKDATTIDQFMNSLCTRYSMYFNRKYRRVGKLFQGVYKAVLVETDEQLLHLSRYIHQNPVPLLQGVALQKYVHSSYPLYLGTPKIPWLNSNIILSSFNTSGFNSYKSFVENSDADVQTAELIKHTALDYND